MDVARIHNPLGLPVNDPVADDARLILSRADVGASDAAGRLFIHLWSATGGEPGELTTSIRVLARAVDAGERNVPLQLRNLERRGLVSLPEGRLRGDFTVGVRSTRDRPQKLLFDAATPPATLSVVRESTRNEIAQADCATPLRKDIAQWARKRCEEKLPTLDDGEAKALAARIEAKRQNAAQPTARKLLERSYVPNVPLVENQTDVPNVPERSGDVKKDSRQRDVNATAAGVEFLRQRDRLEAKYGRKDDCPWLPDSFALLAVRGPLSRAQFENALETTTSWRLLNGALTNQLAMCGEAKLRQYGLWSEKKRAPQFYRFPRIKQLQRSLGVEPDESRFPPKRRK